MGLFPYVSGWLAAALLGGASALALLRVYRRRTSHSPWRWPHAHNRLGAAAAAVGLTHGLLSVTRATLPLPAALGLWIASLAAVVLVWEAVVGLLLTSAASASRRPLRWRHRWLMGALVVLVSIHVILAGPWPR